MDEAHEFRRRAADVVDGPGVVSLVGRLGIASGTTGRAAEGAYRARAGSAPETAGGIDQAARDQG